MKKKRILALFLAAVSCLSLAVSASAAGTTTRKATDFKDYDRTAWYAEAVSAAVDNGLLYGKSSTMLDPNGDMTRAEMAAIINRSFGCYKAADISQYKDVSKSKWYYKDVALAVQMGTYNGRSSSAMAPDAPISRQEAMTVVARALELDYDSYSKTDLSTFSDRSEISNWALPYVRAMVGADYIHGRGKVLAPLDNITRAEFAQIFYNITAGVDRRKMDRYLQMDRNKLISLVQSAFQNYQPKPARRVYIQKSNGKQRPLGIPTVLDRIVQECLRIVLEPLVEAKFFPNSYGFRPYRSVHDAVHMVFHYANLRANRKSWFVIEGDIKGFFDHINHRILLKKLWHIGVHDKRVLAMIKAMLKAGYMEQNTFFKSAEGTPQGGILSPLLANVYLTAFDWTVGRMYQHPRQQTAYICSDRARLLYQGVIPKYLVRYADDWVILTNSEQEAHRFLHWLQKYFTHRLKIELSEEKTVITDMRQAPVNFLGFSFKVRQTAYQPDKPRREIAMSYPNPQKLQKAIRKLCDGVKAVRTCSNDSYRAVQIETVNAQIVGIAEHYKHVLCSEAYHKIDYAVNKCAYKVFKRIYGKSVKDHVIPLENLSNRPTRHAGHKDTALAMQIHGQWIGFTKAYLTHAAHGGHSFHQKITPYTAEGRELYRRKAKKSAPKDRPPLYDGTNLLELSAKKPIYNFEYYMNREYAFNRDKGKCRCCHINLNPGHYHCHHINPKLPINQINKVQNLAWVCENCHKAIHGKAAPSYAVGQVKDKIERFQKQL